MMISQKMADAINEQIKNEFYSGWLYLAMAFKAEELSLKYFAEWFKCKKLKKECTQPKCVHIS